jgi:hypothetical protein
MITLLVICDEIFGYGFLFFMKWLFLNLSDTFSQAGKQGFNPLSQDLQHFYAASLNLFRTVVQYLLGGMYRTREGVPQDNKPPEPKPDG